ALARALYSDCPIILLDDVLSAVDAHVARHLFREVLVRGFAGRTVLLVSHQVQFLPQSDQVIVMHRGAVVQVGAFADL
ncbi:multidrug ABC transporter permease/ATP-binding protein, partial [Escherichia coli]|nr:multidrug ABC transporter permease/ATP-binding protein [Escherichia coli]